MDDIDNPFIFINRNGTKIFPEFIRGKSMTIRVSDQVFQGLTNLAEKHAEGSIYRLLSFVGTYELRVINPGNTEDEERQAGFDDAMARYPDRFLELKHETNLTQEQESYIQGYLEGTWTMHNKG